MRKPVILFSVILFCVLSAGNEARAQQYKLRQANTMMGMKSESTLFVKGMRKRTESAGVMGMGNNPTTIEQCDLQRTIKINDKKRLYYIEPFAKETTEIINEDEKPVAPVKNKPVTPLPKEKTAMQSGGIVNMWYNITDTGERKKMYGFNARHVWTFQKMKPSPEACTMKDSIMTKTDGWYVDLPQFNCPLQNRPVKTMMPATEKQQPECKDQYINHRSGKGKLGFPLSETRTMKMGSAGEFETSIETLEFTSTLLDSMLFEIPPGYKEVLNEDELRDKLDVGDMMNQYKNISKEKEKTDANEQKKTSSIRIGVYEPKGDGQYTAADLQQHMVNTLSDGSIEALAIASEEDAKKYHCDYTLATDFLKIKQGSKVGGLLKAIKNTDPGAASSVTIEAAFTLVKLSDGSTRLQQKAEGKYDGKIDAVAKKVLDDECRQVLKALK